MMRNARFMLPGLIFIILLAMILTSCSNGKPGVIPFITPPPQDSNPVFVATPKPAENSPTPDGGSATGDQAEPTGIPQPPAEHELYFIVNDFSTGRLSLARLPFDCIMQPSPCPPEIIPSYPNVNEMIRPLVWSPSGESALLPFAGGLHRYDPAADTWQAVGHISLSEQAEWSPSGEWIAYIGMSGNTQAIHVVRPDGSEPLNLTANQFTSPDDHLAQLFWLDNENLAFWYMAPGKNKGLFQINILSGEMNPLIQMSGLTKDLLVYSPDRQKVALESFENGETLFAIVNADGSEMQSRRGFGQTSIWPMAWSPDGQWVAFAVYGSQNDPLSHVYIASRDGQVEIKEVFSAELIAALVWAPDSQHLIIQAEKNSPSRLYVAQAASGDVWPLAIASLGEGASISGVSWR